jgi:flagellar basal-body rod protein FlgB
MNINNSFGKTLDILHRSLSVSTLRADIIANNIANADTPNFKRSDMNFETSLKLALDSEQQQGFQALMTDPLHLPFERPLDYQSVLPRRTVDYLSTSDNNGNNVDLEEETSKAVMNQMSYNLLAQAMNAQYNAVKLVLRG